MSDEQAVFAAVQGWLESSEDAGDFFLRTMRLADAVEAVMDDPNIKAEIRFDTRVSEVPVVNAHLRGQRIEADVHTNLPTRTARLSWTDMGLPEGDLRLTWEEAHPTLAGALLRLALLAALDARGGNGEFATGLTDFDAAVSSFVAAQLRPEAT